MADKLAWMGWVARMRTVDLTISLTVLWTLCLSLLLPPTKSSRWKNGVVYAHHFCLGDHPKPPSLELLPLIHQWKYCHIVWLILHYLRSSLSLSLSLSSRAAIISWSSSAAQNLGPGKQTKIIMIIIIHWESHLWLSDPATKALEKNGCNPSEEA